MAKRADPDKVLSDWLERDLTACAAKGELAPAFEVDDVIEQLCDVVSSGRYPVLSGESGVGKTAVVYELARRAAQGRASPELNGKRVLQFSLRNRMSTLAKADQMRPEMQKLVDALLGMGNSVVAFFRDIHLAYEFDLEPQFQLLALRQRMVLLGEGDTGVLDAMFEGTPELAQHYVLIHREEPDLAYMRRLLASWAEHQAGRGTRFSKAALTQALELTYRFLARSRLPRKAVDLLGQVGSVAQRGREISESDVIERFHRNYRVPRFLIDPTVAFDIEGTAKAFRSRVLGQPEAVRAVVRMIGLIKAGLSDSRRPFGAFMFVGPTGVGKTHIAQLLAEHLFGGRDRVIRLNMADFQSESDAYSLFGNPEAYPPRIRRGVLTARLTGHPFGVLLLDEFEKAHVKVHDRFLQLIDEGAFINGAAETVSCRSMIIIATSNAGAEIYRGRGLGFLQPSDMAALDQELDRILCKHFRVEFLNRFDQVVHFHPLSRDDIRNIALREIEALGDRAGIRTRAIELQADEVMLDWLTAHGYDPNFGARFLKRAIERNVTTALADLIVRETPPPGARVELSVRANQVTAKVVADSPDQKPTHPVRLPHGTAQKVKTLDKKSLDREVDGILARAAPFMERLEERRRESGEVLAQMSQTGFWDDRVRAQSILDRFRELDVAVQVDARLAESVLQLSDLRKGLEARANEGGFVALARGAERAALAVKRWEEQQAEEGPSRLWLLLRDVDPLHPAHQWLEELVTMELAWCRRLHLAAEVVAYGLNEEKLARVALEIEGPGAAACLAMEEGVHRLHRQGKSDQRVRIDIVPFTGRDASATRRTANVGKRAGLFDLEITCRGRIAKEDSGQMLELFAPAREGLEKLLQDLDLFLSEPRQTPPLARNYAQGGAGARDPRTGIAVPRFKDVLKGKLDPFLEGWRQLSE